MSKSDEALVFWTAAKTLRRGDARRMLDCYDALVRLAQNTRWPVMQARCADILDLSASP